MNKKTRVPKSREQIINEMKNNASFHKKMAFVKEKFWPALCEAATSVEDANILLEGFNNIIMQTFLARMKDVSLKELDLAVKLDATSNKFLENQKLLALFDDLTVFDAKDYIEGMRNEIALFTREEMQGRPLASLKTKWADEIK